MDALERAEWVAKNAIMQRDISEAQAKLRYDDALALYKLLATHAPAALTQWKTERPVPCGYADERDKVHGWQLDNRRLEQMNRDLRMELAAAEAERDSAQAVLQRLTSATVVSWLDGYPAGLEARIDRLVTYAAEAKTYSVEKFEALEAERDALRDALAAIRDMPFSVRFSQMFERAQQIARAALDAGRAGGEG